MSTSFGAASRPVSAAAPFGFSAWSDGGRSALRVTFGVLLRGSSGSRAVASRSASPGGDVHSGPGTASRASRPALASGVDGALADRGRRVVRGRARGVVAAAPVGASAAPSAQGSVSFLVHPGHGFVSWIMAIVMLQPLLTIHRLRRPTRQMAGHNGYVSAYVSAYVGAYVVRSADVPDRTHGPAARPELRWGSERLGPEDSGWVTAPIPIPAGLPPLPPRVPRSMPGSTSGPAVEPSTCPFPVVGPLSSGSATVPIGRQAGRPHAEDGPGTRSRRLGRPSRGHPVDPSGRRVRPGTVRRVLRWAWWSGWGCSRSCSRRLGRSTGQACREQVPTDPAGHPGPPPTHHRRQPHQQPQRPQPSSQPQSAAGAPDAAAQAAQQAAAQADNSRPAVGSAAGRPRRHGSRRRWPRSIRRRWRPRGPGRRPRRRSGRRSWPRSGPRRRSARGSSGLVAGVRRSWSSCARRRSTRCPGVCLVQRVARTVTRCRRPRWMRLSRRRG